MTSKADTTIDENVPSLTRRRLLGSGVGIAASVPFVGVLAGCNNDPESTETSNASGKASPEPRPQSAADALERLLAGNERFVEGEPTNAGRDSVRRAELVESQAPFAAIVGCSDSRVPPEVLFDQGLGDLFTVRVAGNTATDPIVLGSVEYAAEHLGSALVMVLGHQSCGAVGGAVAEVIDGAKQPGSIGDFIAPIVPVVEEVTDRQPDLSEEALLERCVRANVEAAVADLENAELLAHLVETDKLMIVGAEYKLDSGKVTLL